MKEIRIHGRGGQGNVMAAQLMALAAFSQGLQVQAFPAFGAERTGAPVQAFVRLSREPIRRRSQVYSPDVVIVQDTTLLLAVDVLGGLRPEGVVILNAGPGWTGLAATPDASTPLGLMLEADALPWELSGGNGALTLAIPASAMAAEATGRPIPNTVLLGAFAAATEALSFDALREAIRQGLPDRVVEANVEAARRGFEFAQAVRPAWVPIPKPVLALTRPTAGLSTTAGGAMPPGGSRDYLTGGWRTSRPVFLYQKCTDCDLCVIYCPDGIVRRESEKRYVTDYDFCKGCGICAQECPIGDIVMAEEAA